MGELFRQVRRAALDDHYVVSWHADERCEERGITPWQLAAGIVDAHLLTERPNTQPNPTVVVRQSLADGSEVEVVWAWLKPTRRAKLVTVYFLD